MSHWVYVHLDAAGSPLYVGCSGRYVTRQSEHRRRSPWFPAVEDTAKLGPFRDKALALAFERELIGELQPPHNILRTERESAYYSQAFTRSHAKRRQRVA